MGCLNSSESFQHKFGNIHFSGPCNRACYFCIGQHMMDLDSENNLHEWPIKGLDKFVEACNEKGINEINLTGTNTDPLLYEHTWQLKNYLNEHIPNLVLGVRTNGINVLQRLKVWNLFDKGSISIPSFDPVIYKKMMGHGLPPHLERIIHNTSWCKRLKINIVLGPENLNILFHTLDCLMDLGIKRVNLREAYGQPHIGNPLQIFNAYKTTFGMPTYNYRDCMDVTYWDVHYCEVESVNLYASGRVSFDYPITRGHSETGTVHDQTFFPIVGRHNPQWIGQKS